MVTIRFSALAALFAMLACLPVAFAQPASVADCTAVLKAKDYYSFAQQNNLQVDYIRSIDSETFQQIKHDNSFGGSALLPAGLFSVNDTYSDFNEKRTKYLDNTHYNRTESQATNILAITTAPRAYTAYSECLQHLNQAGLLVWASKEDTNTIELHVRYVNQPQEPGIVLSGLLSGGTVTGAPRGHLWRDGTRWGILQEKVFTIQRQPGSSQTTVIVSPSNGAPPFTQTYYRADTTLSLNYVGTHDVPRGANRSTAVGTPNNDHNEGSCANQVGRDSGKYCISRTPISLATSSPRFFQNVRVGCLGGGCGWASNARGAISPDGLTASGSLDNWGAAVTETLTVDEWEHVGPSQCGGDGPVPTIYGQTVVFTTSKDCLPIAVIKWRQLGDGSDRVAGFGAATPGDSKLILESVLDLGSALEATYKVNK